MSSTTEVVTLHNTNQSRNSLSVRADTIRSTIAPGTKGRHTIVANGDIELAQLPGSATVTDLPRPSSDEERKGKAVQWKAHIQFIAVCWSVLLIGWNDGTTGPLLPQIQNHYHLGYATASLIFVCGCVGFFLGAVANVYLVDKLGFGKVMALGSATQLVGYSMQASAPPYPVFLLAFVINGLGIALQDAGANGYVASIKDNSATKMSIMHSVYGTGAFLSPLSATQFARIPHWSFQYLVSLGLAVINTASLIAIFRFKRQEECLAEVGQALAETGTANHTDSKYRQIFRIREVHYLATFLLLYVGVTATIGGWTATYIIDVRGGRSSAGYISSGFSGGVAFGRVSLIWVTKTVGYRRAVFLYIAVAIALELAVWLVPSLIGSAVAVALMGVVLGPLYPIVITHAGKILPSWLLTGSVGWIAGFAQTGVALVPLIAGTIASKQGIEILQPLVVAMVTALLVLWFIIPGSGRRID